VDFDAFYIVGQLYWSGQITEAYDTVAMAARQRALVGHDGFMPWTYPPQFDLIALTLPALPRGLAYALFTGITLALYLVALLRFAGQFALWVLVALIPPLYVTATIGQNAFLTGALVGLFCLASSQRSSAAGWPLGLLIIKPHLAVGLVVHAITAQSWRAVSLSAFIVLATSLIATLVLGTDIWIAFAEGSRQASAALGADFYPLYRMASIFAGLRSLGLSPNLAIWVQIGGAILACAAIARAVLCAVPLRQSLALSCFAAPLISPYFYDYDLTVIGIGFALVAPVIWPRSTGYERLILLLLIWTAGGWGMIHALASAGLAWADRADVALITPSLGILAYLLALAVIWRILRRPEPILPSTAGEIRAE